jgi:hypothetical protein
MFPESRAGRVAMKIDYDKYEEKIKLSKKSHDIHRPSFYGQRWANVNSIASELLARCRELEAQNEKMLELIKRFHTECDVEMSLELAKTTTELLADMLITEIEEAS